MFLRFLYWHKIKDDGMTLYLVVSSGTKTIFWKFNPHFPFFSGFLSSFLLSGKIAGQQVGIWVVTPFFCLNDEAASCWFCISPAAGTDYMLFSQAEEMNVVSVTLYCSCWITRKKLFKLKQTFLWRCVDELQPFWILDKLCLFRSSSHV